MILIYSLLGISAILWGFCINAWRGHSKGDWILAYLAKWPAIITLAASIVLLLIKKGN